MRHKLLAMTVLALFVRGRFVLATTNFDQSVPCDIFVQQTAGMSKQRIARLLHLFQGLLADRRCQLDRQLNGAWSTGESHSSKCRTSRERTAWAGVFGSHADLTNQTYPCVKLCM